MNNIETGDSVRSTSRPLLNGGVAMNVRNVYDGTATCDYFEGPYSTHKQIELQLSDLIIVHKLKGGFRNSGEAH